MNSEIQEIADGLFLKKDSSQSIGQSDIPEDEKIAHVKEYPEAGLKDSFDQMVWFRKKLSIITGAVIK